MEETTDTADKRTKKEKRKKKNGNLYVMRHEPRIRNRIVSCFVYFTPFFYLPFWPSASLALVCVCLGRLGVIVTGLTRDGHCQGCTQIIRSTNTYFLLGEEDPQGRELGSGEGGVVMGELVYSFPL